MQDSDNALVERIHLMTTREANYIGAHSAIFLEETGYDVAMSGRPNRQPPVKELGSYLPLAIFADRRSSWPKNFEDWGMQILCSPPQVSVVRPQGDLSAENAVKFHDQLTSTLYSCQNSTILVDLEQVEFLDSKGLFALLTASRIGIKGLFELIFSSKSKT